MGVHPWRLYIFPCSSFHSGSGPLAGDAQLVFCSAYHHAWLSCGADCVTLVRTCAVIHCCLHLYMAHVMYLTNQNHSPYLNVIAVDDALPGLQSGPSLLSWVICCRATHYHCDHESSISTDINTTSILHLMLPQVPSLSSLLWQIVVLYVKQGHSLGSESYHLVGFPC